MGVRNFSDNFAYFEIFHPNHFLQPQAEGSFIITIVINFCNKDNSGLIAGAELQREIENVSKLNTMYVYISSECFQISVFEISRVDCMMGSTIPDGNLLRHKQPVVYLITVYSRYLELEGAL